MKTSHAISRLIIISLFSLLIIACKDKEKVTTPEINIFGFNDYEAAKRALGKYIQIEETTEGSLLIDVIKTNDMVDVDVYARFNDTPLSDRSFGGDYFIGDIPLKYYSEGFYSIEDYESMTEQQLLNLVEPYFGNEVSFRLERDGQVQFKDSFYLPGRLKISNLKVMDPYNIFIPVSRNNLKIEWNADLKNENGVVAYIVWTGNKATSLPSVQYGYEETGVSFADNGSTILPKESLAKIPKDAQFTIFFIRGNISLPPAKDGRRYKVYMLSQEKYSFQMID